MLILTAFTEGVWYMYIALFVCLSVRFLAVLCLISISSTAIRIIVKHWLNDYFIEMRYRIYISVIPLTVTLKVISQFKVKYFYHRIPVCSISSKYSPFNWSGVNLVKMACKTNILIVL